MRKRMKLIFPLLCLGALMEPGAPYRPYIHPFSLVSCNQLTSSVEIDGNDTTLPGVVEVNANQVNSSKGAWWDEEEKEGQVQPSRSKRRYLSSLQAALGTSWFSRWMSREGSGATVLSPPYLHMVLASLLVGAEGSTADKFHDVLGLSDSSCGEIRDSQRSQDMHQQFRLLLRDILSHQRGSLSTGTWMIFQEGLRLHHSFVHSLRLFYPEVQLGSANFSQPRVVEESINSLVHRASGGRLDNLVAGLVTPRTNLLVASFIHFKGRWKTRSQCHGTELQDFFNDAGDKVKVPMTIWCGQLQYKTAPEYTMIKLPLSETMYVMLIQPVRPAKMKNFERTLTTDRILGDSQTGFVKLVMPRFVWEGTYNVKELFSQDPDMLGGQANFSRISSAQRLVPEQVIQSIIFEVMEDEREQVIAEDLSVTNTTTEIRINKPFFFRVYDGTLEMLLFLGRVKKLPLKSELNIF
uniref:Angiotensinogen n=1 Tax=Leucoraja erinaceus TaxID=7782 RepID=B7X9Y9_LEUER|nr:angiotensinogen [Leucoraja erinacea]